MSITIKFLDAAPLGTFFARDYKPSITAIEKGPAGWSFQSRQALRIVGPGQRAIAQLGDPLGSRSDSSYQNEPDYPDYRGIRLACQHR